MLIAPLAELDSFPAPNCELTEADVQSLLPRLQKFLQLFSRGFCRSEAREHLFQYSVGLLSPLERKSIEPIALALENSSPLEVRSTQRFLSDHFWDEDFLLDHYQQHSACLFNHPKGVLIADESGYRKKGKESAGVARQYCGELGKVENCQVGVFLSYASSLGYGLLDKRLFLPELWFTEEYESRREACQIPEEVEFQTKPQLALEMIENVLEKQLFQFEYILGDSLYGNSWNFVEGLEKKGLKYFLAIPSNVKFYMSFSEFQKKRKWFKEGSKARIEVTIGKVLAVEARQLAEELHEGMWQKRKSSEGTKGAIEHEYVRFRVRLKRNEQKEIWLVIKRTLGPNKEYKYFISNAPEQESLKKMVVVSGKRWGIEQCFEEMKSELGMGDYEVRKYAGWHHHMFCCMLMHLFLGQVRKEWVKKGGT